MKVSTVSFESSGTRCDADYYEAKGSTLPCVVMAHGFAGTRDSGLDAFAGPIAEAGFPVLAFDYRGFGSSDGVARQQVSASRQQADYRAAITAACGLHPTGERSVVLWGTSFSGTWVLRLAATEPKIAACIALMPALLDLGALRHAARQPGSGLNTARLLPAIVRRAAVPVVGPPGSGALMTAPGAEDGYQRIAGPTWRNEVSGRALLESRHTLRFGLRALPCPTLVQVADDDHLAAPHTAERAARKLRAEVRHYPGDHFDVEAGGPCQESAVAHQIAFLRRHLDRPDT